MGRPDRGSFIARPDANDTTRSETRILEQIPAPPFWGVREPTDFSASDIWPHLDLKTLFRLHWGGKGVKDEAWEELLENEFLPRLRRMQEEVEQTGWMQPRARYGYFPANSEGNDLIIFDPERPERELTRFTFPRQPARERLCLADYFLPLDSGRKDVAAFQIVTMGAVARRVHRYAAGEERVQRELLRPRPERAKRRGSGRVRCTSECAASWVSGPRPASATRGATRPVPDLEQHALVDQLLDVGSIGVEVTERLPVRPGADDGRNRHPPPGRQVLRPAENRRRGLNLRTVMPVRRAC